MKEFRKNDKVLYYQIKHHHNAKKIILKENQGSILVTLPKLLIDFDLTKILDEKFEKLYKMQEHSNKYKVDKYSLWGNDLTEKEFFGKYNLSVTNNHYRDILKLECQAKIKDLETHLKFDLQKINLNLIPTKVKILKSQYGSCNIRKKEITISAFLARIPEIYLYYVLLHEYAHLLVPHHQKEFYEVLDKVMINHKQIQKTLRKHRITF